MSTSIATPTSHPTLGDPANGTRIRFETYLQALSDRSDFARYLHDDVTLSLLGGPSASGCAGVTSLIMAIHSQMFDAQVQVKRTVCERYHATAELVFVGTHTGEFAGVPASGRRVEVPYMASYDFAVDGRISAIRVYLPMQILMPQIAPATA
jgi:steroid delta-isomerase-like uncharacterized protein